MSYLIRDGLGTYDFRRVIPTELRPVMPSPRTGKANWKQSLRTKDPAAAKKAGSRLLRDCMADFEQAERTKRREIRAAPARHAPDDLFRRARVDGAGTAAGGLDP